MKLNVKMAASSGQHSMSATGTKAYTSEPGHHRTGEHDTLSDSVPHEKVSVLGSHEGHQSHETGANTFDGPVHTAGACVI